MYVRHSDASRHGQDFVNADMRQIEGSVYVLDPDLEGQNLWKRERETSKYCRN